MDARDPAQLIPFVVEGVRAMQLPDGLFCEQRVRGEAAPRGRSIRYSLMVELGLLRAHGVGYAHGIDLEAVAARLGAEVDTPDVSTGDLGLYLWADERAARGGRDELLARLARRVDDGPPLEALVGMELGWIVQGLARAAPDSALLGRAVAALLARQEASGLFRHTRGGARSRFPNFATQIYAVLALSTVAAAGLDERALPAARRAADRLLELQRPNGGWPWLYDARPGRVVEPYDIYSVHQHAMAPMGLLALEDAGGGSYGDAARRGFAWILGRNELGVSMVDEPERMIYRSIRRRGGLADRGLVAANTAAAAVTGRALLPHPERLVLNRVCFSYELGWLLEAWCGREDRLAPAQVA